MDRQHVFPKIDIHHVHSWWVFHICNLLEGELWIFCTKNIQYPKVQGLKGLELTECSPKRFPGISSDLESVSDKVCSV